MVKSTGDAEMKYIDQAKLLRVIELMQYLMVAERTIDDIVNRFDISPRTAYRYLDLIDAVGSNLDKSINVNPRTFFLVPGNCPMCGKEAHNG